MLTDVQDRRERESLKILVSAIFFLRRKKLLKICPRSAKHKNAQRQHKAAFKLKQKNSFLCSCGRGRNLSSSCYTLSLHLGPHILCTGQYGEILKDLSVAWVGKPVRFQGKSPVLQAQRKERFPATSYVIVFS